MMKMKYLAEDFDLARQALAHWEHDEATLSQRLPWFRISASAVYPFDDGQGQLCFLRLQPETEKSAAELLAELDFLQYLHAGGYPCMQPIPSRRNLPLEPLFHRGELWHASAFLGVPGQPLEDLPMNSMLAWAYGAALGQLHAASMQYRPLPSCRTRSSVTCWIRKTLQAQQASPDLLAQLEEVDRLLTEKPRNQANYGLVHYDFEPDNVFWDGKACHVIDFGDAMLHFYAIDLVQALDEMEEEYHASFLGGYRDACPTSEADPADFPLMRRFRDLYSYTRLLHCLSEIPQEQPEWMTGLIGKLRARRDELAESILRN